MSTLLPGTQNHFSCSHSQRTLEHESSLKSGGLEMTLRGFGVGVGHRGESWVLRAQRQGAAAGGFSWAAKAKNLLWHDDGEALPCTRL